MPLGWLRDGPGVAEKSKGRQGETREQTAAGAPELLRGLGEETGEWRRTGAGGSWEMGVGALAS